MDVLLEILDSLSDKNCDLNRDTVYRQFSKLKIKRPHADTVLEKVWTFVEKGVLQKGIIYMSILLQQNYELLNACLSYDKSLLLPNFKHHLRNPLVYFDYTVYTKKHWIYELLDNYTGLVPANVQHKLSYLLLISVTSGLVKFNSSYLETGLKDADNSEIDPFWQYCHKEIRHMVSLMNFCMKHSDLDKIGFFNVASKKSILETCSEKLNLNSLHHLQTWLYQLDQIPHKEDLESQRTCLKCFGILSQFFQLILPGFPDNPDVNKTCQNIEKELLNLPDNCLKIELLEIMFSSVFLKNEQNLACPDVFVCRDKQIQLVLITVQTIIGVIRFKKVFENNPECLRRLDELYKMVTDAVWRLELIMTVIKKNENNILSYMLSDPEAMIKLCLKNGDFARAFEVLKIFKLESSHLATEVILCQKLQDLQETLSKTSKIRKLKVASSGMAPHTNVKLTFDEIVEDFFHVSNRDSDLVMNILDLAVTQTETFTDSKALLQLANKYNTVEDNTSCFFIFFKKLLMLFNRIGEEDALSLTDILLNPNIDLDLDKYLNKSAFDSTLADLYSEFNANWNVLKEGIFSKDHKCHKVLLSMSKHIETDGPKYLQKLFNYLEAFSRVLYIEKDTSDIISQGKDSSYFALLSFNRSELMGNLLFQQNLDPVEFEKYFGKLKLDFLYHVVGNCFPTVNLHAAEKITEEELYPENVLYPPSKGIINYIKRRNWLLALILDEMYQVEGVDKDFGESRIQHFINYLNLDKVVHLQPLFGNNKMTTALQNDICLRKINEYMKEEMSKNEFSSSLQTDVSCDFAEEVSEDKPNQTNWLKLKQMLDAIPERQFKKQRELNLIKDTILINIVKEAFEHEYFKYYLDINDAKIRLNLLIENMKIWPEEFCIKAIKKEISQFNGCPQMEKLKGWMKHIELCRKVMNVIEAESWEKMYTICALQPKFVLDKLIASTEVDLLVEFIILNDIDHQMLLIIDTSLLKSAFQMEIPLHSIEQLLQLVPLEHCLDLCQNLLGELESVSHLNFLVTYLMRHRNNEDLKNISLSLQMLSVLNENELDLQFLQLINNPLTIIEVLVMNMKLDNLAVALDTIKGFIPVESDFNDDISLSKIDEVLRKYAEKSLDFRVITQPYPRLLRTPEHKLLQSLDTILPPPFIMPREVPSRDEWVENSSVIECMCCRNVFFSMFNRRHHCRRCGRVVCGNCSKKRIIVESYGDIQVRVCSDCYCQTFVDVSADGDDTVSTRTMVDDYWMLTEDSEHNRIVREEFSYEFAPSVSLCLSLMKFHSRSDEYSKFLIDQCDLLMKLLIPSQEPLQEIDYMLVIRMLKSLALAAKMVSQDTSLHVGSSSADRILTQAELLGLLSERGCLNLLPISNSGYIDVITLRKLRDKLLEREQWNLALEVSTKAGVDKSGVFVAWGISCLKAGHLATAREKFSKCLDKNAHHDSSYYNIDSSSLRVIKNPPLLDEIVQILESKKESIDMDVVAEQQKLLGSTWSLNQSTAGHSDAAIFILNKLLNLKNIESGYYCNKRHKSDSNHPLLDDIIYSECVYYLSKYGTGVSLVEFHMKYNNFDKAVDCILSKKLGPDVFSEIYMKCLKKGSIRTLQAHMSVLDSSLIKWKHHLTHICCQLEKSKLLNSLYQLQLFMGDYIRAAMTCLRFYEEKSMSFGDLVKESHFLIRCQEHLNHAKEQDQWVAVSTVKTVESEETFHLNSIVSPMIKKMSHDDIEKHIFTNKMQMEVAQFLANCEEKGVMPMQVYVEIAGIEKSKQRILVPNLFGSTEQRKHLAVLCMISADNINAGFSMASRLITEFKLKCSIVYKEAGKYMAKYKKFDDLIDLIRLIKESAQNKEEADDTCNEMLIFAIGLAKKMENSQPYIKRCIEKITDIAAKISASIEAGELKSAYYLAITHKRLGDIKKIMRQAEITNNTGVKTMCSKVLQNSSTFSDK